MLRVGDKVPDFELPVGRADQHREKVRLGALLEKGPVVLSFFPLAFTRVCTTQMCDARDHLANIAGLGAQVYGFSCDSAFSNAAFARDQKLPFPILSDANRDVVDALWETQDVAGVNRVPKRGWMVVAPDGTVAGQWIADVAGEPWPGNAPIEAALQKLAAKA
jgi:peroxiredoxin